MRLKTLFVASLIVIVAALAGCKPGATPEPAATTTAPQATVARPVSPPAVASKEDAEWTKVLEAARKEGEVTIYTFNFTGDIGTAIGKAFNDKYGIKVDFVTGIASVLLERIKIERRAKKFIADTLDSAPTNLSMAKDDGLTTAMGDIPSLREQNVWVSLPLADPDGHIVGLRSAPHPVWINTNMVKPGSEPRSYKDLLDPKWKGKITLESPVTSANPNYHYVALKKAGMLDDEFWRRLATQDLRVASSAKEPLLWLSRGEVAVHTGTSDAMVAPYVKEGSPIRAIEMTEGLPMVTNSPGISLLKNGPHPNAARVFVNWLTSKDGQDFYARTIGGFYSLRKDTPDIRPASLRVEMKKPLIIDFPMVLEAAKIQRDGTLAKMLGVETK